MKNKGLIIFLIVVVIIIAIYLYIKKVLNNFVFGDVKFVGGDIASIFNGSGFTIINLSETITNNNGFSVPVSGLYIEVFYQAVSFGKSTNVQPDFAIPANGNITLTQAMTFNVNSGISIAAKLLTKTPIVFDYTVRAKLFGFYPLVYNGNFTY